MFRFRDPAPASFGSGGTVVAIGNFDGVHRGHAAVVSRCVAEARAAGAEPVVLTFDPHPALVLGNTAPRRIAGESARNRALAGLGVARVLTLVFDASLAAVEASAFVSELLSARLDARAAVFGRGFRFGARRDGSAATFAGFRVRAIEVPPVLDSSGVVSSTRVRAALERADLDEAAALLGRAYSVEGTVIHGDEMGRTLGFPTANVDAGGADALAHGVYAATAIVASGREFSAAFNVGVRPTVGGATLRHEAHLLDFAGDLYGQDLRIVPARRLRAERAFPSLDDLKSQIARDVDAVRAAFAGRGVEGQTR